jgi:hypothetical protein
MKFQLARATPAACQSIREEFFGHSRKGVKRCPCMVIDIADGQRLDFSSKKDFRSMQLSIFDGSSCIEAERSHVSSCCRIPTPSIRSESTCCCRADS